MKHMDEIKIVQGARYWPAVAVLCLGILGAVYLHSLVLEREETARQAAFTNLANVIKSSFQREIDQDVGVMESIGGLYAASELVERDEFEDFVEYPLLRHQDLLALEWLPKVVVSQRAEIEMIARMDGIRDFSLRELDEKGLVVEAASREMYFPVLYVEPTEGNEEALGYDMASNPVNLHAMELARDTGQIIVTERQVPFYEEDNEFTVNLFMPVYREGSDRSTVEGLRRNLEGFVSAVVELDGLLEEALKAVEQEGINFFLVDENAASANQVLMHYFVNSEKAGTLSFHGEDIPGREMVRWRTSLEIPGRPWTLYFYQSPYYAGPSGASRAWIVVAVGVPIALLVAVYIFSTLRNTARIENLLVELKKANLKLEKEMAERKRVDKLLREGKIELERKNEELEAFMYMAAHDLRTPIVSIHGFLGLLNRALGNQLDEKQKWVMERISANLDHFDVLLGDLVEFSRVSDDSVEKGDHDLGAVAQQVLDENSEFISALGARVRVKEDLPAVHFNETRLYQVISNLTSNSLKFARDGVPPEVEIGVEKDAKDLPAGQALFYVRDNGVGIEEDQREKIFGLFFRLGSNETTGSGVGLAIVKRIIDLEHGRIWIESVPGEGTTVFFTLPLANSLSE